ncbi:Crp/Fnr family transcriptional regulator [Acidithiobacillus sp.]|jgi:CRP/FNR family transcriptional regulator|uniref:Crp/Fnr family transcriptional regulator n=1 Tax=Acidithiobacillus sp. TaxID=1872118 RepID=UPI003D0379EF
MSEWIQSFSNLQKLIDASGCAALKEASHIQLEAQQVVFRAGEICSRFFLVIDGQVRVQQASSQGRELVLYRIGPGESCILTTACLFGRVRYPASGITESKVEAISLTAPSFYQAIEASAGFRQFVFQSYGRRLIDMLMVIEDIVFTRLDVRLARKLVELSEGGPLVLITHHALAVELGSAREVVSRALKEFEMRAWVRRAQGRIELLDRNALESLARQ